MTKPPVKRTTLLLPPELHKRLKVLAIERGVTLTELVSEALEQFIAAANKKKGGRK